MKLLRTWLLLLALWPARLLALEPHELPKCAAPTCLALDLWLPPQFDDTAWLETQLAVANDRLAVIHVGVQVAAIHQLPERLSQIDTVAQRDQLGQLGKQAPLRWFVVRHLADAQDPAAIRKGVTWRNGSAFWVIESQTGMRWVLAHELGHVLGLPHSTEAASIMNKAPRIWPPPWRIGFTARERPTLQRTLAKLLRAGRLQRAE